MTESRESILAAIRGALGRGRLPEARTADLEQGFPTPRARVVPARGRVAPAERIALFIAEAERVNATTRRLRSWHEVAEAVAAFLRSANLPMSVRTSSAPMLATIPWAAEPSLIVATGPAEDEDAAAFVGAFAGIAETGTLMVVSGPETPTTLNFLPPNHVVALPVGRLVGTYEEAWALLRAEFGTGVMPRTVNWITGPSRTADIEQTLLLGAHGPRRLHILLIDDELG